MNIEALKATGGNVDAAVDRILNMIGWFNLFNLVHYIIQMLIQFT